MATVSQMRSRMVVLVVVDTLRADHLGCYGYASIKTPNIDRLASGGTLYEQAATAAPITLPSVATILTGVLPLQHGVRDNGAYNLGDRWTTLAESFAAEGYATAAFVSAEVIAADRNLSQGFSHYDDDFSKPFRLYNETMREMGGFHEGVERRADETVDRALSWAREHRDDDVFLFVHVFDPHLPRDPPPAFQQAYPNRPYDGEIAFTDQEIGRLLKGLGKNRRGGSVLTIFTSDHGEGLQDHEEELHGFLLFDEMMRVPLIVNGPGVRAGRRVPEQVCTIDLVPTICALAGIAAPGECSGERLPDLDYPAGLRDRASEDREGTMGGPKADAASRAAYLESFRPRLSYGWCEQRGLRTPRWKLIVGPEEELYDLARDPGEKNEVRDRYPQVGDSLARVMDAIALAAAHRATYPAGQVTISPEERDKLESLGYLSADERSYHHEQGAAGRASASAAGRTDPQAGGGRASARAREADSLAVWLFPREERGAAKGLRSPREELPAYNRRVVASSFCRAGAAALASGEVAKARSLYERAIAEAPQEDEPYLGLARVSQRAGDLGQARAVLERGVETGARSASLYASVGELRHAADDLSGAEAILTKGTREYPDSPWCWSVLALVRMDQGSLREAAACATKAIEIEPGYARAHFMRGAIAREMDDSVTARRAWTRYLELEPDAPDRDLIRAYLAGD